MTLDLAGQAKFGPDVEWVDTPDHTFDESRRERFAAAIHRYYLGLDDARLQPGYIGVRPKIVGPGAAAADFRIDGPRQHEIKGLVQLLGIESPGLTCALSLSEAVGRALGHGESRAAQDDHHR